MKNLILKTEEGDLFRFTDSEERTELTIGSRRTADIVVKSQYVEPVQVRLLLKNNIWYAEDMTPENARSVVLLDGRRFKRPMVKFDGVLSIRRAGKKEKADIVRISAVKQFSRKKPKNNFDLKDDFCFQKPSLFELSFYFYLVLLNDHFLGFLYSFLLSFPDSLSSFILEFLAFYTLAI